MSDLSRRALLRDAGALASLMLLGACSETGRTSVAATSFAPEPVIPPGTAGYQLMYGPVVSEPWPIPAIDLTRIDPAFLRREIAYSTPEEPGTIIVDPYARYLYHVQEGGMAMRYGVGVGREGFGWSGVATIDYKREWPDWYPPAEMYERQPELKAQMQQLQSGIGMAGGPGNPLGCRAHYLWQNGKDTLYRIHGTWEPWTIGTSVSSGCIRMINQDVLHLYERTPVGTRVLVLGSSTPVG